MKYVFTLLLMVGLVASPRAQHIDLLGHLSYPETLSNLWGYSAPGGKEYALVGTEWGLSIVDVTDPIRPVQLHFIPGDTSLWREPKLWGSYAYATNEKGGGLMIVDLSQLPDTVQHTFWQGDSLLGFNLKTAHTCFIDEKGFLYLNGSNLFNRGTIICDIRQTPMSPVTRGIYDEAYVHDCFAVNDTLYTSEIREGNFAIIDVKNKNFPTVISRQRTPFAFTHNCWLSEDGNTLFTTDEKKYATVASYDVRDPLDITLLDEYRTSTFDSLIPHNTYYLNGYLYTSYYRNGVTIVDANRPANLVEVGSFDTSPFAPGEGFEGCWGVYCFARNGVISCSDRETGLYLLQPRLQRACYLEGRVRNANGNGFPGVSVEILGVPRLKYSNFNGLYKTGVADSGNYTVRFVAPDGSCEPLYLTQVSLSPGVVTTLNVNLNCFPAEVEALENSTEPMLQAGPNPFTDQTRIYLSGLNREAQLKIFAQDGKEILQLPIRDEKAVMEWGNQLPAGLYTAVLIHGSGTKSLRMVKTAD